MGGREEPEERDLEEDDKEKNARGDGRDSGAGPTPGLIRHCRIRDSLGNVRPREVRNVLDLDFSTQLECMLALTM